MTLRETMEADVCMVLDTDDFADVVDVEGAPIRAIFSTDAAQQLEGGSEYALTLDAVTMVAATADLPRRRHPGDPIKVGGKRYLVLAWEEDGRGISTVIMQRTR